MKYSDLTSRKFNFSGFKYLYSDWNNMEPFGEERSTGYGLYGPIHIHKICDTHEALMGIECIYEPHGKNYFIYPVSELERTGQLSEKDLLKFNNYEIY